MKRSIADMVVIITGASAGIGKSLAEVLGNRGAKLVLAARRLDRLEALNKSLGGEHLTICADVSNPSDCQHVIRAAHQRFGRIDTLVCNAGYGHARSITQMSREDYQRIFETNLFGTVDCIRAAVPIMTRQDPRDGRRGQIMIVSSAAARRGVPYLGAYCGTKAAQLSLAESLRIELQPDDIAVTSVHPVVTETEFFSNVDQISGLKSAALANGTRQTSARVAQCMAKAIERPPLEVWPAPLSRMSLNVAVILPRLVDFFMTRMRNACDKESGRSEHLQPDAASYENHQAATADA